MELKIGEKIRELWKRSGRTQDDLADALGVTAQAVSRWECGTVYPDTELLPVLANCFGVTLDELFGYESDREKKVDEAVKRLRRRNRCSDRACGAVLTGTKERGASFHRDSAFSRVGRYQYGFVS